MEQLLQSLSTGKIEALDIPCPLVKSGHVLIKTKRSLISSGTERMLLEFGRANWLDKIRQQPDKFKQVIDKIKTDGLATTIDSLQSKLDQPLSMGYSNVGTVLETMASDCQFKVGDRVVSNGAHAEVVRIPYNLCAKIPDNVSDDAAVFTVLGAIALQGLRLAKPTLGEKFVVIGLGVIGLLTVQLLKANGCQVLALDYLKERLDLAEKFGAQTVDLSSGEEPVIASEKFSNKKGIDGVIITAATVSNEPVRHAAKMCRKRGRIILVGVSGLELSREMFYEKELTFQVSCSYGPGRYDERYEQQGIDYPYAYVRWTEQRNFEAFLDMLSEGRVTVDSLISHRFAFSQAEQAYNLLLGKEKSLGVVLTYGKQGAKKLTNRYINQPSALRSVAHPQLGFIGAGNYASRVLIPAFKNEKINFHSISTDKGINAAYYGRKFKFNAITTDTEKVINSDEVDAVVISTQHNSHAKYICQSLSLGKDVFVEKPLCIKRSELLAIKEAVISCPEQRLMIGFNRRFAPHIQMIKKLLETHRGVAKNFLMTVNAGFIPAEHWTQNLEIGGGRIIGEACHFVDLLRYLAGVPIHEVTAYPCGKPVTAKMSDNVTIQLNFADGSQGVINYFSNGHKSFIKERLEIFCAGKILQLNNFCQLKGFGWPKFRRMNLWRQDKGQRAMVHAFVEALQSGQSSPIPWEEIEEVTDTCLKIVEKL